MFLQTTSTRFQFLKQFCQVKLNSSVKEVWLWWWIQADWVKPPVHIGEVLRRSSPCRIHAQVSPAARVWTPFGSDAFPRHRADQLHSVHHIILDNIQSFIYSFIHSFIHSFIRIFIELKNSSAVRFLGSLQCAEFQ